MQTLSRVCSFKIDLVGMIGNMLQTKPKQLLLIMKLFSSPSLDWGTHVQCMYMLMETHIDIKTCMQKWKRKLNKDAIGPIQKEDKFWWDVSLSQNQSFPTVYYMPMLNPNPLPNFFSPDLHWSQRWQINRQKPRNSALIPVNLECNCYFS